MTTQPRTIPAGERFPAAPEIPPGATLEPEPHLLEPPHRSCRCRVLDIGLDLDGCCYDYVDALRSYIALRTGRDPVELGEPTCWSFWPDWKLRDLKEFVGYMVDGVNDGHLFAVGDPYPGVVAGTAALIAAGHRVHIITDRAKFGIPGLGEKLTRAWLDQHHVSFTSLTLSPDKTCVHTDVFIEDRPENYLSLVEAGVDVYLRDQPYNRQLAVPAGRRIHSFTEFTDSLLSCRC